MKFKVRLLENSLTILCDRGVGFDWGWSLFIVRFYPATKCLTIASRWGWVDFRWNDATDDMTF